MVVGKWCPGAPMKKALLSLLLACSMVGCQSNGSRIPVFEARQDRPFSVTLKTHDNADQKAWEGCHRRNVWFDVKDSHGQSMPHILTCILWADTPGPAPKKHDATEIKVLVRKDKNAFLIGQHDGLMLGRRIEKPGTYLLEFHVDCYDRKHRLLYSGKTDGIRLHIANRTFLTKPPSAEASDITLLVRQRN